MTSFGHNASYISYDLPSADDFLLAPCLLLLAVLPELLLLLCDCLYDRRGLPEPPALFDAWAAGDVPLVELEPLLFFCAAGELFWFSVVAALLELLLLFWWLVTVGGLVTVGILLFWEWVQPAPLESSPSGFPKPIKMLKERITILYRINVEQFAEHVIKSHQAQTTRMKR